MQLWRDHCKPKWRENMEGSIFNFPSCLWDQWHWHTVITVGNINIVNGAARYHLLAPVSGSRRVYDWCRVGAKHGFTAPVTRYLHSNGVAVFSLPRPGAHWSSWARHRLYIKTKMYWAVRSQQPVFRGGQQTWWNITSTSRDQYCPPVQYSPDTLQGMSLKSQCLNFVDHLKSYLLRYSNFNFEKVY